MNLYIKNYFLSVANNVMALLFPLITFPYVARILGPDKLGIINFAQSYGYYFTHIASFGINSYAIRAVSRIRDDREKVEKISNEIFNLNLFFSLISTVLYFLGVFLVQNFRENFLVFSIYSLSILSNFLTLDWLLQSFDDYLFSTTRNLMIRISAVTAVFALVKKEDDFILYIVISTIVEMGAKLSTLLYSRRHYARLRISRRFLNFRDHISAMFTLFTFRLVGGISANLDKLMIGFMIAYTGVGIYSAGVKCISILQSIVETVGIVLFPKINIAAGLSMDEYKKNLKINYDLILLLGLPMTIGMFLVSGSVIPLLAGEKYQGAVSVSRIMSTMILLGAIGDMLGSKVLLVFKKDRWLLMCSALLAVSNIVLNFAMIPLWGISGAALASVLSSAVCIASRYYLALKIVKIRLITPSLVKYALFCAPFVILYVLLREQIYASTRFLFAFIGLCSLIYAAELFLSRDYLLIQVVGKTFRRSGL